MRNGQRFQRILGAKVSDETFLAYGDRYPGAVSARLRHHIERDLDGRSPEVLLRRILDVVKGPMPWGKRETNKNRTLIMAIIDEYNNARRLPDKE